MLIDDVTIKVTAGHGGDGKVAFNKNLMSLGPVGGSGGQGGNVVFEGVSDLGQLSQFRFKKEVDADDGQNGKGQYNDGHAGHDLLLKVPVGTVIHNLDTHTDFEITKIGERLIVAKGGKGGRGNFHFRSATNTTPEEFEEGLAGEHFDVRLELKLIADIGLIGLPNAGKSTLLNMLTNAKSKVANYPFTTLEPNLGVYYDLILADIPGLIEGASSGKGLGIRFLRHVERTKTLFHLISAESEDPIKDYNIIRQELGQHSPELLKKQECIVLSKIDTATDEQIAEMSAKLQAINPNFITLSLYDDTTLAPLKKVLNKIAEQKISTTVQPEIKQ